MGLLLTQAAPMQAGVDRPPQFIVMAFDNCTELERWQELTDFAAELNKDGDRIHFTFFVSGSNFIADAHRGIYEGPHQRRGYSRISFGGTAEQVRRRVDYVNGLYRNGHEIASHAVGHFNGAAWSHGDWEKEFRSFAEILTNVGPNNGLAESRLAFPASEVIGFRAPYLAKGAGLYGALKTNGFRYDTSGVGHADAWPEKIDGIWRFNLAMLRIQGSGRGTLSMDYNFFVAQSRGGMDPKRYEAAREQTLQTYLHYFKTNYAGNRAPLHIGHHFTAYGGGAYNEALKTFARAVCGLPEVRCVTYAKLADFMDRQNAETLAAYRKGDFARAARPTLDVAENTRRASPARPAAYTAVFPASHPSMARLRVRPQ
jgi:peptidoglycan/xylan/chitin deacetylase (PgdA/CDA1 family)